jgi:hypothetical protein
MQDNNDYNQTNKLHTKVYRSHHSRRLGYTVDAVVDLLTMLTVLQVHFVVREGLTRARSIQLKRPDIRNMLKAR